MFHVNIMPIATCFPYVYTHFPTFFGTNILTRCHSASSLFSVVFLVSEKLFWKYSRNWIPRRPKSLFFQHVPGVRRGVEDGQQGGHTMPRHGPPWPRLGRVWGPWPPTDVSLPPIYSVPRENPKHPSLHPQKVPQPPSSSTLLREGSEALPDNLPERGIITEGIFITCLPLE